jgi:hypothetical protein
MKTLEKLIDALGCAEPGILLGYQHHLTLIRSMEEPQRTDFIKALTEELLTQSKTMS